MKLAMRVMWMMALVSAALMAQLQPQRLGEFRDTYQFSKITTATSEKITIQVPAGASISARMSALVITCDQICDVAFERDGALATTTAMTVTRMNSGPAPTVTAFSASNVGAGTSLGVAQSLPANAPTPFSVEDKKIAPGQNFTIVLTAGGSTKFTVIGQVVQYQ